MPCQNDVVPGHGLLLRGNTKLDWLIFHSSIKYGLSRELKEDCDAVLIGDIKRCRLPSYFRGRLYSGVCTANEPSGFVGEDMFHGFLSFWEFLICNEKGDFALKRFLSTQALKQA